MLGKTEGRGRRGRQKLKWLDSITDSMDMNTSKLWALGENARQGSLVRCPLRGSRELDMTDQMHTKAPDCEFEERSYLSLHPVLLVFCSPSLAHNDTFDQQWKES